MELALLVRTYVSNVEDQLKMIVTSAIQDFILIENLDNALNVILLAKLVMDHAIRIVWNALLVIGTPKKWIMKHSNTFQFVDLVNLHALLVLMMKYVLFVMMASDFMMDLIHQIVKLVKKDVNDVMKLRINAQNAIHLVQLVHQQILALVVLLVICLMVLVHVMLNALLIAKHVNELNLLVLLVTVDTTSLITHVLNAH